MTVILKVFKPHRILFNVNLYVCLQLFPVKGVPALLSTAEKMLSAVIKMVGAAKHET